MQTESRGTGGWGLGAVCGLLLLGLAACSEAPAERVWHEESGYRWAELAVRGGEAGFQARPASKTGLAFTNSVQEDQYVLNRHLVNGSGVALGDVDGDGLADVYLARLDGPNVLYRNLGGFRFEDITAQAGPLALDDRYSAGATFADVNGDGHLDLLVTAIATYDDVFSNPGMNLALFLNDGTSRFTEATTQANLVSDYAGTTLALADVDGDGDLDLYVGNNKVASVRDLYSPEERSYQNTIAQNGDTYAVRPEFEEHFWIYRSGSRLSRFEYAEPDLLYLNDGSGRFETASWTDGRFLDEKGHPLTEPPRDWALAVRFHDFTGDGLPDLYVCNDYESQDRIWVNLGNGRFQASGSDLLRKLSLAAMNVDFADVDRNGRTDFFVVEMLSRDPVRQRRQLGNSDPIQPDLGDLDTRPQYMRNTLYLQREDGTFAETAYYAGLEASEWTWTNLFLDVDLDGYEDVLLTNGHAYDAMDLDTQDRIGGMSSGPNWRRSVLEFPPLDVENLAFRNGGDGRFSLAEWGFGTDADVSHGMASADLDGDGDLDLVINRLGKEALVLENRTGAPRVAVRLKGRSGNTQGIGAVVRLYGGPVSVQTKEVTSGGLYLSGSETQVVFASGGEGAMRLEVLWPGGVGVSRVEGVKANRMYEIEQPAIPSASSGQAPQARTVAQQEAPQPALFEDVSAQLGWTHPETLYEDTGRQPLLSRRLSQLGPSAAWFDADGDGDDDLLLGTGKGQPVTFFRNDGGTLRRAGTLRNDTDYDAGQVLGLAGRERRALVVQQSYEATSPAAAQAMKPVALFTLPGGQSAATLDGDGTSFGPAALADYDGDGDLDLFVGGRVLPARYPMPAPSRFYRNDDGIFQPDDANTRRVAGLGLVSAALWTDLDGDGDPDLVLATEWGPVRLFQNDNGQLADVTNAAGLAGLLGWWNGIASGDFDGDGHLDLIATNWGQNTPYRATPEQPLLLHYGDYDNSGTLDLVEARYDPGVKKTLPLRNFIALSQAIPQLRRQVRTHAEFAQMGVEELFGPRLERGGTLEVNELRHMIFYNRSAGGRLRFEAQALPVEAQLSVAFAATVADYDGDGRDDVFLSQNFFAFLPEISRADAGRGLLLRGTEQGLQPMTGTASGLKVYGEQRAAAAADYDGDGRTDLLVTQNGADVKLYRNRHGRPGLRVRLQGGPANPDGIGASVRIAYADGTFGPVREVQAGSGYWSQNSAVPVLGLADGKAVAGVEVRWPGTNRWQRYPASPEQREVTARRE